MATTVNLGKLRFDWRGDFSLSNSYVINDVVTYRSQQFIAIIDNPTSLSGDRTPLNATRWTAFASMFNNRGTWSASSVSYVAGDIVTYNTPGLLQPTNTNFSLTRSVTQSYICINTHTSTSVITPIDPSYWSPINRKALLGSQTSAGATTGSYNLGVYGSSNYYAMTLPNRGIAFDSQSNYRSGGHHNTTDSVGMGVISQNGQAIMFGASNNGDSGMLNYYTNQQNALTFPFYDWWRSTSNAGSGVHSTPDNNPPRVIQWEKAYDGSLVLMNSGEVFAWGSGGNGEIGNGQSGNYTYPARVGGSLANVFAGNTSHVFASTRIKRISMSGGCGTADSPRHCLALDETGNLWAWGYDAYGQLGINSTTAFNTPQLIPRTSFATGANPTGQSVIAMWACGNRTGWSFAVTQDNQLWAWGYNVQGQLGVGDNSNKLIPTLVTTVAFGGVSVGNVVKVQALDRWNATTGEGCSAILTSLGYIYTTGANGSGWMGNSNTTSLNTWTNMGSGPGTTGNAAAYDMWLYGSGGNRASILIRDNTATGTCYTCGYNTRGQLGQGGSSTTQTTSITSTPSRIQVAGALYNLTKVKQLAFVSQDDDCCATVITDGGFAFSLGHNVQGQASNGVFTSPAGSWADSSGIENINSYVWQPVRTAPGMQGKFDDAMGFGYSPNYHMCWKNSDGRWMVSGYGADAGTGQYSSQVDTVHTNIMTTIAVD